MPADLYETLGVARDASGDEIKRAYKRKAAKAHPDKGGNAADFQHLSAAYRTLHDPQSRLYYDQTGSAPKQEDELVQLQGNLVQLFLSIIDNAQDVDHFDLCAIAKGAIKKGLADQRQALAQFENVIKKRKAARKRLARRRAGNDLVLHMLDKEIDKQEQLLALERLKLERNQKLLKMLDEFQYTSDPSTQATGGGYFIIDSFLRDVRG